MKKKKILIKKTIKTQLVNKKEKKKREKTGIEFCNTSDLNIGEGFFARYPIFCNWCSETIT